MIFVIGDVHGEISKLDALLKNIAAVDKNPQYIFIGDCINKGENSKAVLDMLTTMENAVFLMGNHEYYYLSYLKDGSCADKLLKYGVKSTFIDLEMTFDTINERLYLPYRAYFDNLRNFYETDRYFICHSGLPADCYGTAPENIPTEKYIHNRYDFLSNMSRIRGKKIIFGHTGFFHVYVDDVKIGLDTSAVYIRENPLTAFCTDEDFFIDSGGGMYRLEDVITCPSIPRKEPYRYGDAE